MAGRKRIRLDRQVYSWPGTAFAVTICTVNKQPIFGNDRYARPVFDSILDGPLAVRTRCYAACLMPDHLHLVVAPQECDLVWALQQWKSWTTRRLHALGWRGPVWQRSFYDHVLRSDEDLERFLHQSEEEPEMWHSRPRLCQRRPRGAGGVQAPKPSGPGWRSRCDLATRAPVPTWGISLTQEVL